MRKPTPSALLLLTGAALCAAALAATPAASDQPASAKAQATIDKALDYLKSQQKPDGSWQGPSDPPAMTALPLRCFAMESKYGPNADFVKKGYDKLLTFQVEEGGIYKEALAVYNTAIAISALAAADQPAYRQRMDKAVAYLKSLQWTDQISGLPKGELVKDEKDPRFGGWGYGHSSRPDGSNVNLAMDALHDAGLKPGDKAYDNALKFVSRLQNNSETNDQPWAGNDGGFIYSPAGVASSPAGEYTDAAGRKLLRSYGSMTYAGLKSMIYAGLSKDDPRVKAAFGWIKNNWSLDENPGMRLGNPDNAKFGLYYYYLTMARSLHAYGEPTITDAQGAKHDWRAELIDKLASLQRPDGSFVGDKKWMEDNPILATAYATEALQEARADLAEREAK